MSDSIDDLDDRISAASPRFSGALIGRILAVGLFVTLGTFAVYQSVVGDQNKEPSSEINPELLAQNPNQRAVFNDSSTDADSNIASTSYGGVTAAKPPSKDDSFAPAKTTATTPTSSASAFAPINKPNFNNTKLAATPKIRSNALAPQKALTQSGFGAQTAASSVPTIPRTSPRLAQLPDDVAKSTSQFANNLRAKGADAFSQAKQTAGDTVNKTTDALKSKFNAFNPNPSPTQSSRGPATSPAGTTSSALDRAKAAFDPKASGLRPLGQPNRQNSQATPALPKAQPPLNRPDPFATKSSFGDSPASTSGSGFEAAPLTQSKPRQTPPPSNAFARNQNLQSNQTDRQPTNSIPPLRSTGPGAVPPRNPLPGSAPVRQTPTQQISARQTAQQAPAASNRFGDFNNTTPAKPAAARNTIRNTPTTNPINRRPVQPTGLTPVAGATMATPGDRVFEGVQAPSLSIEKIAPREIQMNQPAEFQIVVRNVGRVVAENVTIHDKIPSGAEFLKSEPATSRGGAGGTGDIQWALGELRPGQEKRVKFNLKPTRQGEIGSVARLSFETKASMRTLVTRPVLKITHSTNPSVLIGDRVVLDVVVENKGDGPANDVVIEEDVPRQLEYTEGYRQLEYPIGNLAPGQTRRVQLALRAAEIGKLKNIVMASAKGGIKAQHALDMEVIAPKLSTSADGPNRRYINREAKHTFTVRNQGTATATNVELVARMPSGLRFVSANNQGKYDANSHSVYWSLAELRSGPVGKVEMSTMPIEPGEQPIKFEAVADLNQKSSTQTRMLVEHLTDVYFEIDDVVDPIEVGSETSYRIRVVNQGTQAASNVQLQVDFPPGLKPTSVGGNLPNEIRNQTVVFAPITNMNPGDEIKIVVNGKGQSAGDHRVVVQLKTDGRSTDVSKEETTKVYNDRAR